MRLYKFFLELKLMLKFVSSTKSGAIISTQSLVSPNLLTQWYHEDCVIKVLSEISQGFERKY